MLPSLLLVAGASVLGLAAQASPVIEKRAEIDTLVLQFALGLEHLENAFYSNGLALYSASDFISEGYPAWVRKRLVQVGQHEAAHVSFLQNTLGSSAAAPCNYTFPHTSAESFLGLASILESVGVSAYLGVAGVGLTETSYITAASSILTTESRHQAWISSAVLKGSAWSASEDTPLGFSAAQSLAAQFIVACPLTNPALPITSFPSASIVESSYSAGDKITLSYTSSGSAEYLIIYSGLSSSATLISSSDKTVTLPSTLQGLAFALISTSSNSTAIDDSEVVAGTIILDFGLSSDEVSESSA
ncbi:ferritin-like domain-containing protein [Mrakia frigida]|uniref:ferritin-like domain-containing protein n=1 Tax=Mrakia frigida TaxID=29902 RepID=UPI003FCC2348